ncbi:crotonase/enoyl-CoA hydratase family protein [Tropicimonas isoalkanivorans]|uniref:Enoyl-CoA hydratase/carnithine racemase n=1 Tax=Tropicimonas isoalkanivorans TaxID=441112 RepID=A0A1I1HRW2_9RHOB|nr:crotonase/enoyl-CoA hydratase family protein [Tropicimonas isoalkanivorans]SFC26606.1 Enoyl-CoA hydratase/carnithine racemase [Tropicimonas isoalkanivorans]
MTDEAPAEGRILTLRQGPLAEIVLDRPKKLNGFTPEMMRSLTAAIDAAEKDATIRVILLRANGNNFTAGLDLPKISEAWRRGESIYPEGMIDVWDLCPPYRTTPLVMAAKGICFTVGVELSLSADIVIAADDCRFGQMEVKRGIMAAGGATVRMVERAGWGNAMRYLLTGDEWDAQTALRFGFVQEITPASEVDERARVLALQIAEGSAPLAVAATRRNARTAMEQGSAAAVAQFDEIRSVLRQSEDAAEGVRSFIEKRAPQFTGR